MAECMFCGDFVGERNGDGGVKGRTVGGRDVCEQCLGELKNVLEQVEKKEPVNRERIEESEEYSEAEDSERNSSSDPFSSGNKI
jgi:hypothetical protein